MRIGVIGGGILGLAVARQLAAARPGATVTVFEKDPTLASQQTGHNSGVVHAGVYYRPGSEKAVLCGRGRRLLERFCADAGIPYDRCGKVIVARSEDEEEGLDRLLERSVANRVPGIRRIGREELAEREPHVRGSSALWSPATAIVDFRRVALALADDARARGVEIRTSTAVRTVTPRDPQAEVTTEGQRSTFDAVVIAAGLHADRLAETAGAGPDPRIVPFRGEYHRLRRPELIRALVYPVPDPRYPFLGVHFTRTIDGEVLVGPNAILALARQGYRWSDIDAHDVGQTFAWPGFWRMAGRHWRTGMREFAGSMSRRLSARAAATYLPGLTHDDLEPAGSGVRAQAVSRDGALVDDFVLQRRGPLLIVRNAPSPAATSSLAIAERLASMLLGEPVRAPA